MKLTTSRRDAALFVVLGGLAFSTSAPISRYARPADPVVVAFGRLVVAAVVLLAIDARDVRRSVAALSTKQLLQIALAGVLLAMHFALWLVGLDRTSLPAAVSLISLQPLAVVLAAWAVFGIRPARAEVGGVGLATAGAVIVARGAGSGDHRIEGDVLVIGAVVLYGLYLAVARALRDALPWRSYATLVYACAAIASGIALPVLGKSLDPSAIEPHSIVAMVALGLVPTIIGHTAVQTASRRLPPAIVALVSPGETVGAIAIGAALLHTIPSAVEVTGAALILVGATIAILAPRPPLPARLE